MERLSSAKQLIINMKKPTITPNWNIGMAEDGLCIMGDSLVEGIRAVVCKCSGWNLDNTPSDKHKSNLLLCNAAPQMAEALEKAISIIEDLPYPQYKQADSLRAALLAAGYTE
jgi:hypothetical protein